MEVVRIVFEEVWILLEVGTVEEFGVRWNVRSVDVFMLEVGVMFWLLLMIVGEDVVLWLKLVEVMFVVVFVIVVCMIWLPVPIQIVVVINSVIVFVVVGGNHASSASGGRQHQHH